MGYNWNWSVFLQPAGNGQTYLDWLIAGLGTTVLMGALAWIIAFLLGSVLGVMRTLPQRGLQRIAAIYVNVMRNIPLIVQLFLWYYLAPKLMPEALRTWLFSLPPASTAFVTATIGLGFFTAARVCEQVRAGVESLPPGLRNASLAVGFTLPQAYRHVLLPVSYRLIIPPMTSEMLSIFKNSSIASTVGVIELYARSRQLNDYTAQAYESFLAVVACYLLINAVVMLLMGLLERRTRLHGYMGAR
ncbi:amino acid ABC transporter permease [Bordetella sp. N]|uniref:amino acid ABC transporter permease n=1 Tax=Bordetella sp. N TaxID=1746199 RepID=UPI00070A0575|nr:amino acid ABC transporter permease [Bordetella sp. N]ALM85443.1 amino acid ABC transporter permease [Bordetella sp. N]